jgi:ectoine hydroxylase-related dioxygenase (phytanoyl-CoA dioxygenase family)
MASAPQHEKTASEWRFDSVSDVTIPEAFARDGFVCLSQVLGSGILDEWLEWSYSHFSQCFELLFQQGHTAFPTHRRNGEYAMSCGAKHGFREVVMRSPGRYELSLLQSPTPLLEPILNILSPVIPQLLQESSFDRLQLCHVSLLMATPGATEQAWHADGGHVSLSQHLPCHCLNVFIPLVGIPMNLGPTELRPGTHFHTRNLGPMMLLAKARKTLRSPVVPLLKAGDVLVFDYRVLHRGRANRDPELHRPILVLSFAKTWFVDVCNFPKRSMYEPCSDI